MQYYAVIRTDDSLYHHGVKGMKWGVRRYQNEDGSYTSKGLSRLKKDFNRDTRKLKKLEKRANKDYNVEKMKNSMKQVASGAIAVAAMVQLTKNRFSISGDLARSSVLSKKGKDIATKILNNSHKFDVLDTVGISAAVSSVYNIGKTAMYAHRASNKGNAKATAKLNAHKESMQKKYEGIRL